MTRTTQAAGPTARRTMRLATVGTLILALALAAATRSDAAQACEPVPGTNLEKFYPVMPGWTPDRR